MVVRLGKIGERKTVPLYEKPQRESASQFELRKAALARIAPDAPCIPEAKDQYEARLAEWKKWDGATVDAERLGRPRVQDWHRRFESLAAEERQRRVALKKQGKQPPAITDEARAAKEKLEIEIVQMTHAKVGGVEIGGSPLSAIESGAELVSMLAEYELTTPVSLAVMRIQQVAPEEGES
tara:strand:+ start:8514 stop:9056 length:543 start_codon:yes stop_codon:yes gene_type:complete